MNNDLISRSELKKVIETYRPIPITSDYLQGKNNMIDYCIAEIEGTPTVEPFKPMCKAKDEAICEEMTTDGHCNYLKPCPNKEERPQGEWIDYDNTFYKCPDCGYLLEKCCPQCQNKVILPKGGAE